jgi:mercuric reductase
LQGGCNQSLHGTDLMTDLGNERIEADAPKTSGPNGPGFGVGLGDGFAVKANGGRGTHIAIIGIGSAAFAAAIAAADRGARVTMIGSGTLGGTCVNVGCVPSKFLMRAGQAAWAQSHPRIAGLVAQTPTIDRPVMLAQQQGLIGKLRQEKYQDVLDGNPAISLVKGLARFKSANTLVVQDADGDEREISADRVLIATGASPSVPPISGLAKTPYWTSETALAADEIPEHLIVLGGSAIGLELAQAFHHLGAQVTLIERVGLLPSEDPDVGQTIRAILEDEGIQVMTETEATSIVFDQGQFHVEVPGQVIDGSHLLVATGRNPNTQDLGLEALGIATAPNRAIIVNDHLATNVPGIYAVGDCTAMPALVYVAAAAGTRAATNMTGGDAVLDLSVVPRVVFTDPQIASVGLNETAAKAAGIAIKHSTLSMEYVPRALVSFDTRGFIKLVADRSTGQLLGAQVVAAEGGEVIETAALAIAQGMTIAELADRLFPYLTVAEGLKLCAQTFTRDVKQLSCCAG